MKKTKITTLAIASYVILYTTLATAAWPTFKQPTWEALVEQNAISFEGCKLGFAKPKDNTPIRAHSITRYPIEWEWKFEGKAICMNLEKPLPLQHISIFHAANEKYSIITAHYAKYGQTFKYRLETPHKGWYCMQYDNGWLSCANDMTGAKASIRITGTSR